MPVDLVIHNRLCVYVVDRRTPCDMEAAISTRDSDVCRRVSFMLNGSGNLAVYGLVVACIVPEADSNPQVLSDIR